MIIKDLMLEAARGLNGYAANVYGRALAGMQTTIGDIWDRCDATPTQQLWLAPTAARIHTLVSGSANDVSSKGTLTLTGQPADTQTVTIGTKVYTFQTVLTNVDGNVLIGATASDTIDNLIAAINLAAGAGTTYAAATTANSESVVAAAGAGDTMILYSNKASTIATTDTADNTSWGGAVTVLGVGARKVRVYYLPSWGAVEKYQDVWMHGVDGVAMTEAAVIINRMEVIASGATSINSGAITATAATDTTISAVILAATGRSQMAVYGVPAGHSLYITRAWGSVNAAVTALAGFFRIAVCPAPDVMPTMFRLEREFSAIALGTPTTVIPFEPYLKIQGPAIVKMQATCGTADTDGSAGFEGIVIPN